MIQEALALGGGSHDTLWIPCRDKSPYRKPGPGPGSWPHRESDPGDYAVIASDPQASSVSVTWVLAEDGSDVTRGELLVPTSEPIDAGDLLQQVFLPEPRTADGPADRPG